MVRPAPLRWAFIVGMTLLGLSAVFPLLFMLQAALRTQVEWASSQIGLPSSLYLDAFGRAWVQASIARYFLNSVIVTLGAVGLSTALAATSGFAMSKIEWRGRTFSYFFILSWIALPPILLMVPIYVEMVDLGLVDTYSSVILLYSALNLPFNVFLMSAFFRAVPDELLEVARVDGASVHSMFVRIMLPLSVPALATLAIFNALYVWNEFVFALLLLHDDSVRTLTVGVNQLLGKFFYDYPALLAGMLIASLPMVGVYLVFQKYLVRAVSAGALKG